MTETPENRDDVPALRAVLGELGIGPDDIAVRPLVGRGLAEGAEGAIEVTDGVTVPELTVTTDGLHWHPLGADRTASPDFLLARGDVPLDEGVRLVVERFLHLRREDGTLPEAFRCAV